MMWTRTINLSLFQNSVVVLNEQQAFFPGWMHILRLLGFVMFCHEVELLADLRFCFIFSLILPFVDFGI